MNKFTANKSKIFFAVSWLFVAALFLDGANVGDLIPGTVVIHSDDYNDSQTDSELLVSVFNDTPVRSHSLPQHPQKQETPQPATPLRMVYDQDSDSLAAAPILASESFVILPPQTPACYESVKQTHFLYLLDCTLLI